MPLDRNKYRVIFIIMKIQFTRDILVEVWKPRLEETWDKNYKKWDEIEVESISEGTVIDLRNMDGDLICEVPRDSFKIL